MHPLFRSPLYRPHSLPFFIRQPRSLFSLFIPLLLSSPPPHSFESSSKKSAGGVKVKVPTAEELLWSRRFQISERSRGTHRYVLTASAHHAVVSCCCRHPPLQSINYVGDKGKADVRDDSYVHLDYRLQHVWLINALPFTGSPMRCAPMLLQLLVGSNVMLCCQATWIDGQPNPNLATPPQPPPLLHVHTTFRAPKIIASFNIDPSPPSSLSPLLPLFRLPFVQC